MTFAFYLILIMALIIYLFPSLSIKCGKLGRDKPVISSPFLLIIGVLFYFELVRLSDPTIHSEYSFMNYIIKHAINPIQLTLSKILDKPTLIISIILTPFFWLLWIWRHNDKERDKRDRLELSKIQRMERFSNIIKEVVSPESFIRDNAFNLFTDHIRSSSNVEDIKNSYNQIIKTLLLNIDDNGSVSTEVTDDNGKKRSKPVKMWTYKNYSLLDAVRFQIWYFDYFMDIADEPIILAKTGKYLITDHLPERLLMKWNYTLINFQCHVSVLKKYFDSEIVFSNSILIINEKIDTTMEEYLLTKKRMIDLQGVEIQNYETDVKILKAINEQNEAIDIDIEGYEKEPQKQLEEKKP